MNFYSWLKNYNREKETWILNFNLQNLNGGSSICLILDYICRNKTHQAKQKCQYAEAPVEWVAYPQLQGQFLLRKDEDFQLMGAIHV